MRVVNQLRGGSKARPKAPGFGDRRKASIMHRLPAAKTPASSCTGSSTG
jgi:hypothetical protein